MFKEHKDGVAHGKGHMQAREMETGVRKSQNRGGVLEMLLMWEIGARAQKGD